MTVMPPGWRKVALTAHVTTSVGWLGAVAVFLALAVTGLTSDDPQTVRGVYVAAKVTTWLVIVPLNLTALLTGLVQSLGTTWGLFRHYWVLIKLLLTVVATVLLLLHTQPIGSVADAALSGPVAGDDLRDLRVQLVGDAVAALLLLLTTTALSVWKPRGLTRYGQRSRQA